MKKLIAALLVGTMVFSLSACGSKETASTDAATEASTDAASEAATDAAEGTEAAGGTLVMATNAEFPPYEYYEGGEVVGIDADIARAIAEDMGMEVKIEDMAFDSIIAAVQSGKADFGAAGMTVTEDRLANDLCRGKTGDHRAGGQRNQDSGRPERKESRRSAWNDRRHSGRRH